MNEEAPDLIPAADPHLNASERPANPFVQIEALRHQAMAMGANDGENDRFDVILKGLASGELTADQARAQAQGILESKQDYH